MSYTTLLFAAFLILLLFVYYLVPPGKQWWVLLVASYLFYCWSGLRMALFLAITTISTWYGAIVCQRIADRSKAIIKEKKAEWSKEEKKAYKEKTQAKMKGCMLAVLVLNLSILVFFKYYGLLAEYFRSIPAIRLALPLGISFYTFQSAGYMIDVYRGDIRAERNLFRFALFISFFPQIIQGPISSFEQLGSQLFQPHRACFSCLKQGFILILWGYLKKLVIADRAAIAISLVTAEYSAYNGTVLLYILLLYALQLYADFSAGIDISRGIAQMLGIRMVENFRRPYFSKSINEYWRRWHITLGAWMKSYVFYPLAISKMFLAAGKKISQSRFGKTEFGAHTAKVLPTSVASFVVFLLVGIWHGASGKYVAFGVWNGGIIMLSSLLQPFYSKWKTALRIPEHSAPFALFQMLRTFLIVLIGYVFDIAPDFSGAIDMMRRMLMNQVWGSSLTLIRSQLGLGMPDHLVLLGGLLLILCVSFCQERKGEDHVAVLLEQCSGILQGMILLIVIAVIAVLGVYGPGYDAAAFVYMQF